MTSRHQLPRETPVIPDLGTISGVSGCDGVTMRAVTLRILTIAAWVVAGAAFAETDIRFGTHEASKDLRGQLLTSSLLYQALQDRTDDPEELLAASQADYARLLGVLYANARYGGVITIRIDGREAAGIAPLDAPSTIGVIAVDIIPGPVYLFSDAEVTPLAPGTELPESFAVGLPAETDTIRTASEAAVEGWRADGHAKASVADQRIIARHSEDRISARISLAPGPKLSFGTVGVQGNKDVRTRRILTIAGLRQGQDYDPVEIDRALRRLRRTGSFQSVTVNEADAIGPNDTLPLTIGVVEQIPRRFGFGAEYSTVEGVRLSGFWLHRNLLGGAERLRVEGDVGGIAGQTGGIDYSLGVRYERPATPKADIDLFATVLFEHLDEPEFTSDTGEFTLGFTRYATDDLVVDFGLGYLYSDVTDDYGREQYSLLTLPLGATYEKRDNPLKSNSRLLCQSRHDAILRAFRDITGNSDKTRYPGLQKCRRGRQPDICRSGAAWLAFWSRTAGKPALLSFLLRRRRHSPRPGLPVSRFGHRRR